MKAKLLDRWPLVLPFDLEEFSRKEKDWEIERTFSMYDNLKKGDVLIDIGAELGDYSALFATWGAKVANIEPEPKYWPIIKKTFELNNVTPIANFAGFCNDITKPIPDMPNFDFGNRDLWPKCAYEEMINWQGFRNALETGVSTPQIRLDDFVSEHNLSSVDMLTIDVEGAELHVLGGAVETLRNFKPIVYVSLHPTMLFHDHNLKPEDLFNHMAAFGYQQKHLATNHEEHWVFWHKDRGDLK